MNDIDLLVHKADLADAVRILNSLDYAGRKPFSIEVDTALAISGTDLYVGGAFLNAAGMTGAD